MREALFIKKNKDRWLKEQHLPPDDPDEMASSFTQLVDDLAYAKTFYPGGKVTQYINAQASRVYLDIYRNRKDDTSRLWNFWKKDLPLTIRKHHGIMLFCLLLFVLFFIIGFFTAAANESVAEEVLGTSYIRQTHENIDKGNPFGIYEGGNSLLTWLGIMVNNIIVALRMVSSGLLLGIPAIYSLAETGVMVGVFDQLFAAKGLGVDFWLVVFVHGTLEITAIILAGGAGLILCKGFLFPGTIRRIDAFKHSIKDGTKIMIGLLPVFAVAAFFEGFITRLYNDISWLTTGIFSLSVLFVCWYFIIYPIRLHKKLLVQLNEEEA